LRATFSLIASSSSGVIHGATLAMMSASLDQSTASQPFVVIPALPALVW
jgi:hypothetical protein